MIAVTARAIQSITRFIEVTGAANIGWTEAGCIEGNDPHNGRDACGYLLAYRTHPIPTNRFYKPIWVEEAEEMYAALDETRARIELEEEPQRELERRIADAHNRSLANIAQEKLAPVDVFQLEWDDSVLENKKQDRIERVRAYLAKRAARPKSSLPPPPS